MLWALLATAFLPEAQPLLLGGYCEPLAGAILVLGTFLICRGRRFFFSGVLLLSLLPLVRPNFLPLWASVLVLTWWFQSHDRSRLVFGATRRLIAAALLFYIPSALWVARNYFVSGAFPVMAGTSSMTFYGNYNPVSAAFGPGFARWIRPDKLPDSDPSKRPSEVAEFRYYDSKGGDFVVHHWKIVPVLMGAHVILSMLPSPLDGAHKYSFWALRLLLYAAAIVAVRRNPFRLESWFGVMLACSVLMTAITVVLYSGEGRYLYPQNILLIVLVFSARYGKAALPNEPRTTLQVAHEASAEAATGA